MKPFECKDHAMFPVRKCKILLFTSETNVRKVIFIRKIFKRLSLDENRKLRKFSNDKFCMF